MSKPSIISVSSSENSFYIKFYPAIKTSIGCEKAALILGRMEYWFTISANGFYKFIEPCPHPLYREGDSWQEEVGFPRKIFAKAFDLIGVRYRSKTAFQKANDKFQGKLYASYHDRKTNKTYFIRNHEFASQFIKGLFSKKSLSTVSHSTKIKRKKLTNPIGVPLTKNGRSRDGHFGRSSGGTIGGKENNSIQIITSSLESPEPKILPTPFEHPPKKVMEEMIEIWKEEVGDLGTSSCSEHLLTRLGETLKSFFDQSLDSWKTYCRMISSSKFLMGEAHNKHFKKAWITWAIKEETIDRIRGGDFRLGDRETKLDSKINYINGNMNELEIKREGIETKINEIREDAEKERLRKIREKTKNLPEAALSQFKKEFIEFLKEENSAISKEFRKNGWKGLFVESYFKSFLEEKIESQFFSASAEEEAIEIIKNLGLIERGAEVRERIGAFKKARSELTQEKKLESLIFNLAQETVMAV